MSNRRYIIDANVLIVAARDYFAIDIFQKLWSSLKDAIISGRIILIDKVRDEIMCGSDTLSNWCRELPDECISRTGVSDILLNYGAVLEYLKNCGYYQSAALELWAKEEVADPWIIATAMSTELSVITTNEKGKVTLDRNMPSKEAKIPNVAQHFGIPVCSLVDVLRDLNIRED